MKISVHLEADSPEEVQAFFAAFYPRSPAIVEDEDVSRETLPPVTFEESPVQPQATPEPVLAPHTEEPAEKPKRGRKPKMAPIIEEPEDEPTEAPVAAQEAPKTNGKETVSRQDLLDVFAEYVQRYSANYGYTDISNLLQQNFGGNVRKASDVPEDMLGKAVAAIRAAITDNPFNRKRDYA